MKYLTSSVHIEPDTRFRIASFTDRANPFVSLCIEGDFVGIALIAAAGTSEALRNLAITATQAADALDVITTDTPEVTGRG